MKLQLFLARFYAIMVGYEIGGLLFFPDQVVFRILFGLIFFYAMNMHWNRYCELKDAQNG